jgi:hypothetical protein
MKKISKILFLICVVFACCFLTSCRSSMRQETQKTDTKSATVSEKVVSYSDTILFAPKAETSLKIPVSELVFKGGLNADSKPRIYTQKNGQAKAKITILRDTITVTASCDSLAIVAKIKKELQTQANTQSSNSESETLKKTGYTLWDIIIAVISGLVIGFIIGFIVKTFFI